MKKNKGTKRALFTSFLALLLSMSMLAGTTFAWFTDEVISGNNTIMAGNLDVELKYASAPGGTYTSVEGVGDLFVAPAGTTKGLWEPGHTEVAYLQVHNAGSLHLQYNLAVSPFTETVGKNADNEDIKLSEILKFAATEPSETEPAAFTRETAQAAAADSGVALTEYQQINVPLAPGATHYVALVVYMPESVNNKANYRGDVVPTIEFAVSLLATQEIEERDSFGKDYDDKATYPNATHWVDEIQAEDATSDTAAGTFLYENKAKTFRAAGQTTGDVTVTVAPAANDALTVKLPGIATVSYDIKVEGHIPGSEVVIDLFVGEGLEDDPVVYHKETQIDSTYNKDTGFVTFKTDDFSPFTVAYGSLADTWDGTADTTWYNDTENEFVIKTAEQLAGLADLVDGGNTFAGKIVKLGADMDLYHLAEGETDPTCFDPIGSYREDKIFEGIFDGQDHTIANMTQNTWALNNGYYYGDLGLGLFGAVENATIKNLVMDKASLSGESALCGVVAAVAGDQVTFENIKVTNSQAADYQYYAGGIVGWAGGDEQFINCVIDASTTIAAQWGDFDNSTGGVIGGAGGSVKILMKDCDVACRIDAYNDVTSSYQWFAYRRCGMLIGNSGKTVVVDGTTYAAAPQLTCENVTVTYGEWANYTYCEFAGTSWPYVRVQAGVSNSAYSNPRYGHPTDANGNEVVNDNHVHNDGEDHFILCEFDQLYGGGQGVYGDATHDGVKVIYNNK